jgi:hypothetical protein
MACAEIDDIVHEINDLLDEQLCFLSGDLRHIDVTGLEEYEGRYERIRRLCEQLAAYPLERTSA